MLILSSAACRDPRGLAAAAAWPGPLVFAALPGHGLRRAELRAIEEDAVVIDCVEPPPSLGALLCGLAARLPWLLRGDEAPLLLAGAPLGPADLAGRRALALSHPRAVRPEWEPADDREAGADGRRLVTLLLGAAVASHPLAPDVLALLDARWPGDGPLTVVLRAALGGEALG